MSVGVGGTVTITVDRIAGANTLINGLFLGEAVARRPQRHRAHRHSTSATPGNAQVALALDGAGVQRRQRDHRLHRDGQPAGPTCTSSGLGCTIGGLTNGTSYSFTVAAQNAVGRARLEYPVGHPGDRARCADPDRRDPGNGQVALAWTAPRPTAAARSPATSPRPARWPDLLVGRPRLHHQRADQRHVLLVHRGRPTRSARARLQQPVGHAGRPGHRPRRADA